MVETKVYQEKPQGFAPQANVVAGYIDVMDRILMMQLAPGKPEAGKWGVPAGKIDKGEALEDGLKRELWEESGIDLKPGQLIDRIGALYICKPHLCFEYHLFYLKLDTEPKVTLSREHVAYQWVNRTEMNQLDLMISEQEALSFFFQKT